MQREDLLGEAVIHRDRGGLAREVGERRIAGEGGQGDEPGGFDEFEDECIRAEIERGDALRRGGGGGAAAEREQNAEEGAAARACAAAVHAVVWRRRRTAAASRSSSGTVASQPRQASVMLWP